MANYKIAIDEVLLNEGGYVDDPNDNGGETYRGIARKFWSGWIGWTIVDFQKTKSNFPGNLRSIVHLNDLVAEFYKANFWDKIGGDGINDQSIANMLVDTAVLEGIPPAIKRAQGIVQIAQNGKVSDELVTKLNLLS